MPLCPSNWKQPPLKTKDQIRNREGVEDEELPGPSSVLEQMYANILGPHETPTQESDDEHHISEQLDQYLCEPLIDRRTGQPLEWWK